VESNGQNVKVRGNAHQIFSVGALPQCARQRPSQIRNALTEKHVAADSNLAQFVGL